MSDSLEQVMYDLARAALAQQGEQVANLRARAGTLIAGAALSNSVFAALAIDPGPGWADGKSPRSSSSGWCSSSES